MSYFAVRNIMYQVEFKCAETFNKRHRLRGDLNGRRDGVRMFKHRAEFISLLTGSGVMRAINTATTFSDLQRSRSINTSRWLIGGTSR